LSFRANARNPRSPGRGRNWGSDSNYKHWNAAAETERL
jgi:hypothetical protein